MIYSLWDEAGVAVINHVSHLYHVVGGLSLSLSQPD